MPVGLGRRKKKRPSVGAFRSGTFVQLQTFCLGLALLRVSLVKPGAAQVATGTLRVL